MMEQNRRRRSMVLLAFALFFLIAVTVAGILLADRAMVTDFTRKNIAPCGSYPFGTDWMGRDMLARTLTGLSMSIRIGLLTATLSTVIAFVLGSIAAVGGKAADAVVSWLIDLTMGVPHLLLLVLVSFAVGRGFRGVFIGVTVTHWMSLARVVRGEILQLKESIYIRTAAKLGMSKGGIVRKHLLPHLIPQLITGFILLFPHAILHEASVTFLGFGLPPEQPAIGVILSESMRYLAMGKWWLALFPGLLLVFTVLLFDIAGKGIGRMADPGNIHK